MNQNVCAIVVTYFPDAELGERLARVLPQVGALVVVDNTPEPDGGLLRRALGEATERAHVVLNRENRGIAAALNQGLEWAVGLGFDWVLTLDQDTTCADDMVATLIRLATTCETRPAVVGSNYPESWNGAFAASRRGPGECVERRVVITAGCLVDAGFAREIGGFREDFFMDSVDLEFCLRVRDRGRSVVISRKPLMEHRVGDPPGRLVNRLARRPSHPPLRQYYIARNSVALVREYWRREPRWCAGHLWYYARGLVLMAMVEDRGMAKVWAFGTGLVDGLLGRMGPCRRSRLLDS